jgi:hypothetical protein
MMSNDCDTVGQPFDGYSLIYYIYHHRPYRYCPQALQIQFMDYQEQQSNARSNWYSALSGECDIAVCPLTQQIII